MLKQNHRAWVEIDLSAIKYNVQQLKRLLLPSTELMAIVKADAYGHGAVGVSQSVLQAGASWLGVATIPEGIQLRKAGITAPIAVLGATNSTDEIRAIAEHRLQATLCTPKQALVFHEVLQNLDAKVSVHLKIDTGMSRLGTDWRSATEFVQLVSSLPQLEIESVYSHLATADHLDRTILKEQQGRFTKVVEALRAEGIYPRRLHLANTAGMLSDPDLHYDIVRPGLGIYGLYPAPHFKDEISLRPAMQVKARITQIKEISAGTGISYGYSFIAPTDMKVATVAIGYADGVPRGLSNRINVVVHEQVVAQVGTITMDQCLIDVTHVPAASVGDAVTILGKAERTTADDWADILGTISWEILCGFKHRLPRLYVSQSANAVGYIAQSR
jgi:alanine racemase